MVQMRVFLGKILSKFELIWDPKNPTPVLNPRATLTPKKGIHVLVKQIKNEAQK